MRRALRLFATSATVLVAMAVGLSVVAPPAALGAAPTGRVPILVLGDSLCVGARNSGNMTGQLQSAGWEPEYRCLGSQQITWGIDQVRALPSVPHTVVVALGTNGGRTDANFAAKLATMRSELHTRGAREVIWVNYANRANGYAATNLTLALFALGHGDLHVDWNAQIQSNPQWFQSDGLHYTVAGSTAWARAIVDVAGYAHLRSTDVAVDMAVRGDATWTLMASGEMYVDGTAVHFGGVGGLGLNGAPRAIVPTASGQGYWIMGADGGVFTFGDAAFLGSTGGMRLNAPVVSMAATPSGSGYWLLARDGGVFTFGDAAFVGSTGAMRLNQPIVGMDSSPTGSGYWLLARDGGVFTFGDAGFFGSTGAMRLNSPVIDMVATSSGLGYWLAASDGGVFSFGDAAFKGAAVGLGSPTVAVDAVGDGYALQLADGRVEIRAWP
jgi:lysophospholipase L1-like esterase